MMSQGKKEQETGSRQHVIRLSHVPYGFFEKEMYGYFSQFGQVKRVRLVRNKKGHHTGVAFVEFTSADVAKIAAQTMDNYLLAENRLRCRLIVKQEDLPNSIRGGKLFKPTAKPGENRIRHAKRQSMEKSALQEGKQRKRMATELRKRMAKIEQLGINYHFDFESKLKRFAKVQQQQDEIEAGGEDNAKMEIADAPHMGRKRKLPADDLKAR